jgi:diguanylate cyclase (GGDEF)-like protein
VCHKWTDSESGRATGCELMEHTNSGNGLARNNGTVYSVLDCHTDPAVACSQRKPSKINMTVDIVKQLDRAKRYIEKNKLDDAIEAYHSVLDEVPTHLESIQALADLYARQNRLDRAAIYYGMLFDKMISPSEEARAVALYTRFLKSAQQPPERVARYAVLLQRQNRIDDAIEQFTSAALAFELTGKGDEALACFGHIAQMDPENRDRHIAVAELADRMGDKARAARGYLRAGQLSPLDGDEALAWFGRANELVPHERSIALLYGRCLLAHGDAKNAADLLAPLAVNEKDDRFLETFADALIRSGQLDEAAAVLGTLTRQGHAPFDRLIALAQEYVNIGADEKAVGLLTTMKKQMLGTAKESEFASAVDQLLEANPKSLRLAVFWSAMYGEMNRETKYFETVVRLFDLYLATGQVAGAVEALDKLIDIDPYDFRNQERVNLLEGLADSTMLGRLKARLSQSATHGHQPSPPPQISSVSRLGDISPAILGDVQARQSLEDLLVQAEIFVQYSLQSKAVERLQKIVELFPEEKGRNERLQGLFEAAHWWPEQGAGQAPTRRRDEVAADSPNRTGAFKPETLRDLAKISEINQNVLRQPSARAMLSVAVNEVGKYLQAARCIAVLGASGLPPQMASEYCAPGVERSVGAHLVRLIAEIEGAPPDPLGGLSLYAEQVPVMKEMGLESVHGVQLTDPETQAPAGRLIAGFAEPRVWKPNETYFMQSIGDQMLLCVHHMRLRSIARTVAVADEKTGLLARGAYLDCLLHECQRARTHETPLSLALFQVDGGPEMIRQFGEATFERLMEQLARGVLSNVRQTDLPVKYTSWALAIILPDTSLDGAQIMAQKLRKVAGGLRPLSDGRAITATVAIAEAVTRQEFDSEDIVTDLINRAEFCLEEAQKRGGNAIVTQEIVAG